MASDAELPGRFGAPGHLGSEWPAIPSLGFRLISEA